MSTSTGKQIRRKIESGKFYLGGVDAVDQYIDNATKHLSSVLGLGDVAQDADKHLRNTLENLRVVQEAGFIDLGITEEIIHNARQGDFTGLNLGH